ncbi:MAG TPA: right-handed parallel beta-helix repeat-containing protein [Xanthobacteraceae bacterium]|nr:right-handed parallel beta-helix repeat-containing protein [Xanthobacteraceae bacterium]
MRLKSVVLSLTVLGAMLTPLFYAAPAQAQATRTWVSGVGDDANPCSRTAPCKTWAGAIVKTAAGGEIDNLDDGGFGALTITKSITLDGGGGAVASTLVSGTNGMNIAAGSTDIVILRNIRFQGLLGNGSSPGTAGITAISFTSGEALIVDNCDITGFNTNGIAISTSAAGSFAAINNTRIENVGNAGIVVNSTATTNVSIDNVHVYGALKFGLAVASGNSVTLSRSVMAGGGGTSSGVEADPGAKLFASHNEISNNNIGVQALGTVVLNDNDITFNTTGISGATSSYLTNRIFGNGSAGTAPTSISPGQQ